MTNLTFDLWSPKGRCYGSQLIFGAIHRRRPRIGRSLSCFQKITRFTYIVYKFGEFWCNNPGD